MFRKTVSVSRRLLALEHGDLGKTRGISEFRLRDQRNWPGDDLQSRTYRRTWFNQRMSASEIPEEPMRRLDETMYTPKRWREREYQATWRENEELESQKQEVVEEPQNQGRVLKISDAVPQRIREPLRRLRRVAIPAGEFFSKFNSDQKKRRMLHYEEGVIADRLLNEEYQMV